MKIINSISLTPQYSLLLAVTILTIATFGQLLGKASKRDSLIAPNLSDMMPQQMAGWTVVNRPIADSPELLQMVEKVLNFDSALHRVYTQGNKEFTLFAAYWLPGKIHPSLVDAHTPDVCWVANGWSMDYLPALNDVVCSDVVIPINNHRRFYTNNQQMTVLYWHLDGSAFRENQSVAERFLSLKQKILRRFNQVFDSITQSARPQLFVRISTSGEIKNEINTSPVKEILAEISNYIIKAREAK